MQMIDYHRSLNRELHALKDRIRNLIDDQHWLTDGEWKESVLRYVLRRHLPESVQVGRGFIFTPTQCSKQIDILIYDSSSPLIFKDGNLVFVTPDAVRAIIEVKSTINGTTLRRAIDHLQFNSQIVAEAFSELHHPKYGGKSFVSGLFAYDTGVHDPEIVLGVLQDKADGSYHRAVNLLSLGDRMFFRFWEHPPQATTPESAWNSYELHDLAAAYFIGNVVSFCSPFSVTMNARTWFPLDTKETHRTGSIPLHKKK